MLVKSFGSGSRLTLVLSLKPVMHLILNAVHCAFAIFIRTGSPAMFATAMCLFRLGHLWHQEKRMLEKSGERMNVFCQPMTCSKTYVWMDLKSASLSMRLI